MRDDPSTPESFAPAADPTRGSGDGLIRTGSVYDGNSNLTARLGDRGERHPVAVRQPRPPGRHRRGGHDRLDASASCRPESSRPPGGPTGCGRDSSTRTAGPPFDFLATYDYVGPDRVVAERHPLAGTRETHLDDAGTTDVGYDGLGRTVGLRDLRGDNSVIVGSTYTYDRADNPITAGMLHDPADSEAYTYDSADRLTSFTRGVGGHAPSQSQGRSAGWATRPWWTASRGCTPRPTN